MLPLLLPMSISGSMGLRYCFWPEVVLGARSPALAR